MLKHNPIYCLKLLDRFINLRLGIIERYDKLLVLALGHIKHDVHHHRLANRAQAARTEFELKSLVDDVFEHLGGELQLDVIQRHQCLILADDRVLGLGEY